MCLLLLLDDIFQSPVHTAVYLLSCRRHCLPPNYQTLLLPYTPPTLLPLHTPLLISHNTHQPTNNTTYNEDNTRPDHITSPFPPYYFPTPLHPTSRAKRPFSTKKSFLLLSTKLLYEHDVMIHPITTHTNSHPCTTHHFITSYSATPSACGLQLQYLGDSLPSTTSPPQDHHLLHAVYTFDTIPEHSNLRAETMSKK